MSAAVVGTVLPILNHTLIAGDSVALVCEVSRQAGRKFGFHKCRELSHLGKRF